VARIALNLMDPDHLRVLQAQWRFAPGFVPGEPNEGLVSGQDGSPARLSDYDDSGWEVCEDLTKVISSGFTFAWYRINFSLPSSVGGNSVEGSRCLFETCIDDYGEIWVDGECDRVRGTVQGFNIPQRVPVTTSVQSGSVHTLALLAANGPLAAPIGGVFVRYVTLAFEW
jgi:hypothetical protein